VNTTGTVAGGRFAVCSIPAVYLKELFVDSDYQRAKAGEGLQQLCGIVAER
jgi:hypothetical protein